jgi:cell division GTPase FtsZ
MRKTRRIIAAYIVPQKRAYANIIVGATFDESLIGVMRVSVVATGVAINPTNNVRAASHSRSSAPPQPDVAVPMMM